MECPPPPPPPPLLTQLPFIELNQSWCEERPDRRHADFFLQLCKSDFSIYTYSQTRKPGFQKSEILKHPFLSHFKFSVSKDQVENADVLDIVDFFPSNFYKSDFVIFTYSQTRKLGFKKSEIFKHPFCRYSPTVKHENLDFKNPRFTSINLSDHKTL